MGEQGELLLGKININSGNPSPFFPSFPCCPPFPSPLSAMDITSELFRCLQSSSCLLVLAAAVESFPSPLFPPLFPFLCLPLLAVLFGGQMVAVRRKMHVRLPAGEKRGTKAARGFFFLLFFLSPPRVFPVQFSFVPLCPPPLPPPG